MKLKYITAVLGILPIVIFSTGAILTNSTTVTAATVVDEPQTQTTATITTTTATKPTEPQCTYFDVPLSFDVQDHIITECEKHNINPAVIIAMIERESRFNTYAVGDDGRSAGLMQIQAKWHLQRMINLNCTNLFDPYQNITVGVDILAEQLNRYGDIAKALTAYNRGSYQGTITNYAKQILKKATEVK